MACSWFEATKFTTVNERCMFIFVENENYYKEKRTNRTMDLKCNRIVWIKSNGQKIDQIVLDKYCGKYSLLKVCVCVMGGNFRLSWIIEKVIVKTLYNS